MAVNVVWEMWKDCQVKVLVVQETNLNVAAEGL